MTAQFFSPKGLADYLVVPIRTIWQWIREGKFKNAGKFGKHYRIPIEDVEELIKKAKLS